MSGWRSLAAEAAARHSMDLDEFWASPPAWFAAMRDATSDVERQADRRAAMVAAMIRNVNRKQGTAPISADDLLPSRPQDVEAKLRGWAEQMAGQGMAKRVSRN